MTDKNILIALIGVIATCIGSALTWLLWWLTRPALHFSESELYCYDIKKSNEEASYVYHISAYSMRWSIKLEVSNRGRMTTTITGVELNILGRIIPGVIEGDCELISGAHRTLKLYFDEVEYNGSPTSPTPYIYFISDAHGKKYKFKGIYKPD